MKPGSFCPACLMPDAGLSVCPHCGWRPGEQAVSPQYLPPGTVVYPPYQVARVLGHGGFGITYLGWDANLQIKVAIKEYLPRDFAQRDMPSRQVVAFPGDAERHFATGLQQFLDEARTLAKFQQHPGIVSVLTFFRAFGTGYMVMEYVQGETLKDYLKRRGGRLNWRQTLDVFMHIMDALRAVHGAGLLHRDIAPDNIYLCRDGRIKLLDFGAARQAGGGMSRSLVVVKPGFAPEEQYHGTFEQGPWSDVYSVAASMYFCLTGQVPVEALDRAVSDRLLPPTDYGVLLPQAAERALLKALAVKAWQRQQSIQELQQQLLTEADSPGEQAEPVRGSLFVAQSEEPIESISDDAVPVGRRWWMIAAMAVALLLVVYNLTRVKIEEQPAPVAGQRDIPASGGNERSESPTRQTDEGFDWEGQRERERAAAEELKQQQAAALRRFEEYRKQENTSLDAATGDANNLHREHLRNLCEEWGATMDCRDAR